MKIVNDNDTNLDADTIINKWGLAGLRMVDSVKVPEQAARQILMTDVALQVRGTMRNLKLEHVGLGIYKVRLNDDDTINENYIED